jgi:hypothetical protein
MSRRMQPLAVIVVALLLASCAEPYGDIREELKLLAKDVRGKVPTLGPAPVLPRDAPPLAMERDPFSARGSQR